MTAEAVHRDPLGDLIALAGRRALTVADLPADDHGQTWLLDGMLVVDSFDPAGFTIADLPANARVELIDGSMYVSPGADLSHQRLVMELSNLLGLVAPSGLLVLPSVNVIAGDGTLVMPDVAIVDPVFEVANGLGVSPEGLIVAIEVTSRSTRRKDLTIKRDLYAEWGVPLVIIDRKETPHRQSVFGVLPEWAANAFLP